MTTNTTTTSASAMSTQLAALVVRNLRTTARVPQLLMFSLTMPMAMLVLFSQVFRSVADAPGFPAGVDYIDFITPAMLAVATVMAGTNVGVAAAIDHTNGLHDRFRTLAMPRGLPAVARTLNEMVFTLARAGLLVGAAWLLLGFRFHGDAIDAVGGLAVLIVLAGAMSALFGRIGDRLRRPDVVQFAGMMVMMPLMFMSSAFAPLGTMPGWMRALANANPVSHATDALRGAVLGTATASDILIALAAAVVMWLLVNVTPSRRL
jgi:ABC-2 type transport system permease protein